MKLLLCPKCSDVFKLSQEMRTCRCKYIKGRYIDNVYAEVSDNAISIALGNGSIEQAWFKMLAVQSTSKNKADRREYIEKAKIDYAWVRPNSGPGNPHTKLIKEKKKEKKQWKFYSSL